MRDTVSHNLVAEPNTNLDNSQLLQHLDGVTFATANDQQFLYLV
ncbi:hypothetical protein Pr1d_37100 [Bythopirellula goksoeyrii]|uniref:Uncharacterized protein n=1 Tax=Bythopirellula goksoeyrii TaxID=1400387 RepID=A0A5B9QHF2_9BACT|nr:hypothetical protein Pr1d_37100 [Bythopirellula goksoeyrii]